MSPRSKASKRKKRMAVWRKSGGVCVYCGMPLSLKTMTLDHVLPKSRGGDGRVGNLVSACRTCNEAKGDREADSIGIGFWIGERE